MHETNIQLPFLVVGDSHTRAFACNPNFLPMFAGAGKENCFISDETFSITRRNLLSMMQKIGSSNPVILFYGEPDTRYYLGKGWYPWQSDKRDRMLFFKRKIRASFRRYVSMIEEFRKTFPNPVMLLNISPSKRVNQNRMVDYFNGLLEAYAKKEKLLFLNINDRIYSGGPDVIREEYVGDVVHLNNRIQPLVEEVLLKEGLLKESGFNSSMSWNHDEMMKRFVFDEKFGCYRLP